LECTTDPSILGGLIVEMDGKILDGSIRRRLQDVKEVMNI
jgi:F0F1-type ATP synthase delta subunit